MFSMRESGTFEVTVESPRLGTLRVPVVSKGGGVVVVPFRSVTERMPEVCWHFWEGSKLLIPGGVERVSLAGELYRVEPLSPGTSRVMS